MPDLADLIPFSSLSQFDRLRVNGALRGARNDTCRNLIGLPRGQFDQACRDPSVPAFRSLLVTADLGPFRATGIRPAVAALQAIMTDIKAAHAKVHDRLVTAGMLCCRLVRGSASAISNHSWGIAIDIGIDRIDPYNDGTVQRGLLDIYPVFLRHGFFWGAAFGREDAMHFEASDQLVRKWAAEGAFGTAHTGKLTQGLTYGDRSAEVMALQAALNAGLGFQIAEDGTFGKDTRGAVIEWQRRNGVATTGIASRKMLTALGLT